MKHTPLYSIGVTVFDKDGCQLFSLTYQVAGLNREQETELANRIVACVNAFDGIEDPQKWVEEVKNFYAENREQIVARKQELEQTNKRLEEMGSLAHAITDHLPSIPDQIKMRVRINTILGINAGGGK